MRGCQLFLVVVTVIESLVHERLAVVVWVTESLVQERLAVVVGRRQVIFSN
jgi:hypothetical protein